MEKYIVNNNMHGYTKLDINEYTKDSVKDSLVVLIIDETCVELINKYYTALNNLLSNRNRVIMVGIGDENNAFRVLASLMITYRRYDIYFVSDEEDISASYLLKLEGREPDLHEVQNYIGGDLTAYNDLAEIVFGIESLVDEGSCDKLKDFIENHMLSIENLTETLNLMKKTCEVFNSKELLDQITKLRDDQVKFEKSIEELNKTLEDTKYKMEEYQVSAENLKRENKKLKDENSELESQTSGNNSIIKSYQTVSTALIHCKTKLVIYFKEISYVNYTNTLVTILFDHMVRMGLKCKLVIYDSQTKMYMTYNPLRAITGADYLADKDLYLKKTSKLVVAEPNTLIINDILTSDECFDVVVVYDRMKELTDIVKGNNVKKFYVVSSSKEYSSVYDKLENKDKSDVISTDKSTLVKDGALTIPYIKEYNTANSEASKIQKFIRLELPNKANLINTILKKSRVNTLLNK